MPASEVAAPAAQVDAAQDHLAITAASSRTCSHHLFGRRAAAAAAHEGDDAERAAVVAAVLDLQVGARAVAGGVFDRRGEEIALREDIADVDVAVIGRAAGISSAMRVLCELPTTHSTPGQRGQFLRRALRVAAGDQNARAPGSRGGRGGRSGAHPRRPMQSRCRCSGPPGRRRARCSAACRPRARQSELRGGAIGLRGPAPEILNEELPHLI